MIVPFLIAPTTGEDSSAQCPPASHLTLLYTRLTPYIFSPAL